MSKIAAVLEGLRAQARTALIPYIMVGDPDVDATLQIMSAMTAAGADIIELGVPFSDPMADGPVIQKAAERALINGTGVAEIFNMVRSFRHRDKDTPIVLMGYANPIERFDQTHGGGAFVTQAQAVGIDGVLVVDYPPEECEAFAASLKTVEIDPIFLLAPTSTQQRIQDVGRIASGYVYYVSLRGVTGAAHLDVAAVAEMLKRIRVHVNVPVGVGFGIRDGATARAVATAADAVVIGSALVQLMEAQTRDNVSQVAGRFIAEIRAALDTPGPKEFEP